MNWVKNLILEASARKSDAILWPNAWKLLWEQTWTEAMWEKCHKQNNYTLGDAHIDWGESTAKKKIKVAFLNMVCSDQSNPDCQEWTTHSSLIDLLNDLAQQLDHLELNPQTPDHNLAAGPKCTSHPRPKISGSRHPATTQRWLHDKLWQKKWMDGPSLIHLVILQKMRDFNGSSKPVILHSAATQPADDCRQAPSDD